MSHNSAKSRTHSDMPWRLALSLLIGPACWLMPHQGVAMILLPQKIADISPNDKVALVAAFSSTSMIIGLFSNILFGAFSDITRTRFGKRTPWIVGCSIGSALLLYGLSTASSIPMLLAWWCCCEAVINGVAAPMIAQLSDRIPDRWKGTVSACYGISQTIGNQIGIAIASLYLDNVRFGIRTFAIVAAIGGLASMGIAGEPSNLTERGHHVSARALIRHFIPPTQNAGNFYKALISKFLMLAASGMTNSYLLYIATDYLHARNQQSLLSTTASITLITGITCSLIAGPLSDRLNRVKSFVVIALLIMAAGSALPAFSGNETLFLTGMLIVGIGMGVHASVDQKLNLLVLPNPDTAAKDLGVMNVANTMGTLCGSLAAAYIIGTWGYHKLFIAECLIMCIGAVLAACVRIERPNAVISPTSKNA
ncbi:MFS transporter [Bifidobacterium sp. SMB2]|uniref:MFS transporter n=2 Tax=Bifidobacterium TaxID=1678 RepID=A0ABX0CAW2_9BIFI|nr:MFS transporter [Bifidobacterium sp. SMB2]NEH11376.1 MFS transporter [Bifidobacterium saimiriisciurei]